MVCLKIRWGFLGLSGISAVHLTCQQVKTGACHQLLLVWEGASLIPSRECPGHLRVWESSNKNVIGCIWLSKFTFVLYLTPVVCSSSCSWEGSLSGVCREIGTNPLSGVWEWERSVFICVGERVPSGERRNSGLRRNDKDILFYALNFSGGKSPSGLSLKRCSQSLTVPWF